MEPELNIDNVISVKQYDDSYEDDGFPKAHDDNYAPGQDDLDGEEDFRESDSDEHLMVIKTEDDPEIEFATPRRSIYMTEKSSKKKMIKNGKIVMGKAQRKDKGKTRYTAYMLWAKEARHQISSSNPELDFASVSKRLGEMWANVPTNVKYNWKRRAKRLANKIKKSNGAKGQAPQPSKYMQQKYYLNKTSTNQNVAPPPPVSTTPLTKQQKQLQKLLKSEKSKTQSIQNAQKQQKEKYAIVPSTSKVSPSTSTSSRSAIVQFNKPLDLAPIDIAAHLKLLGESLINIGERLSQHEVSLDSRRPRKCDSNVFSISGPNCCFRKFFSSARQHPLRDELTHVLPQLRSRTQLPKRSAADEWRKWIRGRAKKPVPIQHGYRPLHHAGLVNSKKSCKKFQFCRCHSEKF
jgi:HMG (high mobility group) box